MDHQLHWTPGQEGKGFILLDGTLYTWDCPRAGVLPSHVEKEREYGINPEQIGAYLILNADGLIISPYSPKRGMIHEVPGIDSRLRLNEREKEWSFSKVGIDFNPEVVKGIEVATPFEYESTQPVRTPFLTTEDENDAIKIWVGRPSSAHASLIKKYDLDYRDEMIMDYGWMNQDEVGFYTEGYDHDKVVQALSQYTGVQFKHMSRDNGTWTFGHIAAIDYSQYANPRCKYCYGQGYFFDGDQDVPCRMCIKGLQPQTDLRVREKDYPSRKQLKDKARLPTLDLRQSGTEEYHQSHWELPDTEEYHYGDLPETSNEEWGFEAKLAAESEWTHGNHGKALYYRSDKQIFTWNTDGGDGNPTHFDYNVEEGLDRSWDDYVSLVINPEGEVSDLSHWFGSPETEAVAAVADHIKGATSERGDYWRFANEQDDMHYDHWGNPCDCTFKRLSGLQKEAGKLHDFLMNPKSRPDLQTPEAQAFLKHLDTFGDKIDPLTPWLTREWKKGRVAEGEYGQLYFELEGVRYRLLNALLSHWADFYRSSHPLRQEMGDIMKQDVYSFRKLIHNWDEDMKSRSTQEALEGGEVVYTLPNKWTIRNLTTPEELEAEGDAMGHCVGGYDQEVANGSTAIYSLRDPKNQPHVTVEYDIADEQDARIIQIQGKGNEEPKPEYQEMLKHFFANHYDDNTRPGMEGGHIAQIDDLLNASTSGTEYGLKNNADVDWDDLTGSLPKRDSWRNPSGYDHEHGQMVYDLAKEKGEVPKFAEAVTDNSSKWQEDFDEWREQNYDQIIVPYPVEEVDEDSPEMQAYYEDERMWAEEHPGMQAANHLHSLINPHHNGEEYTNEVHKPATFAAAQTLSVQNGGSEIDMGGTLVKKTEPWEPGDIGKAIVLESPTKTVMHVWKTDKDGRPHHAQILNKLRTFDEKYMPVDDGKPGPGWEIDPDGRLTAPYQSKWDDMVPEPFKVISQGEWHFNSKYYASGWTGGQMKGLIFSDGSTDSWPVSFVTGAPHHTDSERWDESVGAYLISKDGFISLFSGKQLGNLSAAKQREAITRDHPGATSRDTGWKFGTEFRQNEYRQKVKRLKPTYDPWDLDVEDHNRLNLSDRYHLAPTSERARIMRHGLQPSRPAYNERWFSEDGDNGLLDQPEGVYTLDSPERVLDVWSDDEYDKWDIWRIPESQFDKDTLIDDPATGVKQSVIPHHVYPELHSGPEHGHSWKPWTEEQKKRIQTKMVIAKDKPEPWSLGNEGKGFYIPSQNKLVTWKTTEWDKYSPDKSEFFWYHHFDMMEYLNVDRKSVIIIDMIEPDGEFDMIQLYGKPSYVSEVQAINPDMRPTATSEPSPWRFGKIAQAVSIQNGGHQIYPDVVTEPWQLGKNGKGVLVGDKLHLWEYDSDVHHHNMIGHLFDPITPSAYKSPAIMIATDGYVLARDSDTAEQIASMHPDLNTETTDDWRFSSAAVQNVFTPWDPGSYGKGVVDPEGKLHMWTVDAGSPHHEDFLNAHLPLEQQGKGLVNHFYEVDPEGGVTYSGRFNYRREGMAFIDQDPRLHDALIQGSDWTFSSSAAVQNGGFSVDALPNRQVKPWKLGEFGKGILYGDKLYLWSDTDGLVHHYDVFEYATGGNYEDNWDEFIKSVLLYIEDNGTIHNAQGPSDIDKLNQIITMHPDLKIESSEDWTFSKTKLASLKFNGVYNGGLEFRSEYSEEEIQVAQPWKPGLVGKGIIEDSIYSWQLHIWATDHTGEPHHAQIDEEAPTLEINSDGSLTVYEELRPELDEAFKEMIANHPDLKLAEEGGWTFSNMQGVHAAPEVVQKGQDEAQMVDTPINSLRSFVAKDKIPGNERVSVPKWNLYSVSESGPSQPELDISEVEIESFDPEEYPLYETGFARRRPWLHDMENGKVFIGSAGSLHSQLRHLLPEQLDYQKVGEGFIEDGKVGVYSSRRYQDEGQAVIEAVAEYLGPQYSAKEPWTSLDNWEFNANRVAV